MDLEAKMMQKLAWDIFHLTEQMRHMGYDLTTDKARNKGQYTINDIAARTDRKALRTNTDEFDKEKFHNALYACAEVRNAAQNLTESMQWWENQLIRASGQEPIKLK